MAKTGVEFGDLLTQVAEFGLEVTEDGKESGLGGGGDQIPKFLGNGRLLRHGLVIGSNCLPGYIPGDELLPRDSSFLPQIPGQHRLTSLRPSSASITSPLPGTADYRTTPTSSIPANFFQVGQLDPRRPSIRQCGTVPVTAVWGRAPPAGSRPGTSPRAAATTRSPMALPRPDSSQVQPVSA